MKSLPSAPFPSCAAVIDVDNVRWNDLFVTWLSRDGEDAWTGLVNVAYFAVACVLLLDCSHALRGASVAALWRMRVLFRHQSCLTGPSASLHDSVLAAADEAVAAVSATEHKLLLSQVLLEAALIHNAYRERRRFTARLKEAIAVAQLNVEVTGVLGRRTAHQESETAQLVVAVQPHTDTQQQPAEAVAAAATRVPSTQLGDEGLPVQVVAGVREYSLDNSDVLSQPAFLVETDRPLSPLQQALLLAMWYGPFLPRCAFVCGLCNPLLTILACQSGCQEQQPAAWPDCR